MRAAIIPVVVVRVAGPAPAEPVYCSTWQQITTCSSPDGYRSTEWSRDGTQFGQNSDGNRWTTSRWNGFDTTSITVKPAPR